MASLLPNIFMDVYRIGSVITHNIQKVYANLDLMALNSEDDTKKIL
jgi:hypothetical protein